MSTNQIRQDADAIKALADNIKASADAVDEASEAEYGLELTVTWRMIYVDGTWAPFLSDNYEFQTETEAQTMADYFNVYIDAGMQIGGVVHEQQVRPAEIARVEKL